MKKTTTLRAKAPKEIPQRTAAQSAGGLSVQALVRQHRSGKTARGGGGSPPKGGNRQGGVGPVGPVITRGRTLCQDGTVVPECSKRLTAFDGAAPRGASPEPSAQPVSETFRKFPTTRALIQRIRQGRGAEVAELLSAVQISEAYYRVRRHLFGKPFRRFQVEGCALKHRKVLHGLDVWLNERSIPVVPYLRCQLGTWRGRIWFNALRTEAALVVWTKWYAEQQEVRFLASEREAHLASLERTHSPDRLVALEIERGLEHVAYVRELWGEGMDEETVSWLERGSLPGGYLLTVESLFSEWVRGGLEESTRERMQGSWNLLRGETSG